MGRKAILLMGLRGSGKSTVGSMLARATGRPFVDLDHETLRLLNAKTVQEVWDQQGERAFRDAELRALQRVLDAPGHAVVALGGGTPMIDGFADTAASSVLVYLRAEPGVLRSRFKEGDANRPSLTGTSSLGEIETVFEQRDGRYRELAHHEIDAGAATGTVLEDVLGCLGGE